MANDEVSSDRKDTVNSAEEISLACPHCGHFIEPWEGMEEEIARGKATAVCSPCGERILRIERRILVTDVEGHEGDVPRGQPNFERELASKLEKVLRKLEAMEKSRGELNGQLRQLVSPLEQQVDKTHLAINDFVAHCRERDKREQQVERIILQSQRAAVSLQSDARTMLTGIERLQSPSNGVPRIHEQVLTIAKGLEVPLKYLNFTARNGVKLTDEMLSQLASHLIAHLERHGVSRSDGTLSELGSRLVNGLAPESLGPKLDEYTRLRLDQASAEEKRRRIDERLPDLLEMVLLERNGWSSAPPAEVSEAEQQQVLQVLERLQRRVEDWAMRSGVTTFAQEGDPFDMAVHEKVGTDETDDETRFDRNKEVLRSGYRLTYDDSILRRARVIVWVKPRKAPAANDAADAEAQSPAERES